MKLQIISGLILAGMIVAARDTEAMRTLWRERTGGVNLALGYEVAFSTPPAYHLTKDERDAYDLTDGKLSANKNDFIWWEKDTVGWFGENGADNGINLLLDLGAVKAVDKVVIRCLGGASQNTLRFPQGLDLLLSRDGKSFHRAASMRKLMPAEMGRSNFVDCYFLEENGTAYVYPFELQANASARYIGLTLTSATGGLFTDELAVIEGDNTASGFDRIYRQSAPEEFHMSGVIIRPRLGTFDVPIGVDLPNFLTIRDMRTPEQRSEPLVLHVEAPAGLTLTSPLSHQTEVFRTAGEDRVRISVRVTERPYSNQQIIPLFFRAETPFPPGSRAVFYTTSGSLAPIRQEFHLRNVIIPPVVPFSDFHVSLAWMGEKDWKEWPGFYAVWKQLGFNAVSSFPRYWGPDGESAAALEEAREHGFRIIMNESPLHVMMEGQGADSEIFCPVEDLRGLCPSYRGEHYRREIDRVARMTEISRPDYVFMDIEAWYNSDITAMRCPRCSESQRASGLVPDQYPAVAVREVIRDLHEAIIQGAARAGTDMPVTGLYGMHPSRIDSSQKVMDFKMLYPCYIDIAQPSLYYGNYVTTIREIIREDYKILNERRSIPWLTAGTYGEFDPRFLEYIVLEAFLNGVSGITYYIYSDFDTPQDFYYHARALSLLGPHEKLLVEGNMVEPASSNPDISLSAWQNGSETLILAGNYAHASEKITLQLPGPPITAIRDIRDAEAFTVSGNQVSFQVPKGSIRLFHVRQ